MSSEKPRRFSGIVIGLMMLASSLVVLNFGSINVCATDPPPWDPGRNVTGIEWYENCNITMLHGNLIIEAGGTLVFNNSVNFNIVCGYSGQYGIIIKSGGEFVVNSPSANTIITYGSSYPNIFTYKFENSGTIDFL